MEYFVKIIEGHRSKSKQFWKYTFIDTQTNQTNFFYHQKKVDYVSNLTGKLSLYEDKSFKSFEQDLDNTIEGLEIERETTRNIEQTLNHFKKRKIKLVFDFEHLHRLHNRGYTWREVAKIYEKHEQTIYYWLRTKDKILQKRGAKPKFNEKVIKLLLDYNQINNTATQQERANYISRQMGQKISQQTVSLLLKKLGITRKKLTFHYNQLGNNI